MKQSLFVIAVCALAGTVLAAPITGTYTSPDVGNDFLSGRWTESYVGGAAGQVGNTLEAGSWDGASLYTQWRIATPAIGVAPVLLFDGVDAAGNGARVWQTSYAGGTFELTDAGPWWNAADAPAPTYVVDLTNYEHTTTQVFVGHVLQTYTTSVYVTGTFRDFAGYAVTYLAAAAVPAGEGAVAPVGYPAIAGASAGAWGQVQKIRMEIVPEPATLALLALGGLAIVRRRRTA